MATPLEQQERLREFGLSEYASRSYLALLSLGTSEARPISRLARVPIAKVYSTLDQLAEKGLCTVEPGPPKRFSPVPIERYLDQLAAQYASQAQAIEGQKAELARLFPLASAALVDDRGLFHVLRGRRATVDKLRQLYEAKPQSVLLMTADGFTSRSAATSIMETARENGTRLRVLARIDASTVDALERLTGFAEVRAKERGMANIMVSLFDTRCALITHFIPDDGSSTRGQDVSLFTTEEAIVGALQALVEHEWERAEPLAAAKARIALGDPAPVWRSVAAADVQAEYLRIVTESPGDAAGVSTALPSNLERFLLPFDHLRERGHRIRFVLDVRDLAELEAAERLGLRGVELRHQPDVSGISAGVTGDWVLFSFRGDSRTGPVNAIVTNDGRFRRVLMRDFESRWDAAATLADRRAELTRYGPAPARLRMQTLQDALDLVTEGIAVLDGEGRVLYANHAGAALLASPLEGLVGKTAAEVAPASAAPALLAACEGTRRTGEARRVQVRVEPGARLVEVACQSLGNGSVLLTFRDAHGREGPEAAGRDAPRGPTSAWWEYDPTTGRAWFSREARDVLGVSGDGTLLPHDAPEPTRRLLEGLIEAAIDAGAGFVLPWRVRREGAWLHVRTSGEPVGGPGRGDLRIVGTLTWSRDGA